MRFLITILTLQFVFAYPVLAGSKSNDGPLHGPDPHDEQHGRKEDPKSPNDPYHPDLPNQQRDDKKDSPDR
jgi:hypothetical protein